MYCFVIKFKMLVWFRWTEEGIVIQKTSQMAVTPNERADFNDQQVEDIMNNVLQCSPGCENGIAPPCATKA